MLKYYDPIYQYFTNTLIKFMMVHVTSKIILSFLQILAPELNDRLLADFLDMESSLIVSMHIQSVDQANATKMVKRKITDLERSKNEEQKKEGRAG